MTVGERLKAYRTLAQLSQNQLAQRAKVPRPTISELEAGNQVGLTLANAKKLAKALGITLDDLAGPDDNETQDAVLDLVGA